MSQHHQPTTVSPYATVAGLIPGLKRDLARWALKYPDLRARLVSDPKAVVEEELGISLPLDLEVQVVEETPEHVILVIPRNPYQELTDGQDLEHTLGLGLRAVAAWAAGRQPGFPLDTEPGPEEAAASPEAALIARAWQDADVLRSLRESPRQTVLEVTGIAMPEDVALTVLEEDDHTLCIVLPAAPGSDWESLGELTEADLASLTTPMVAGSAPTSTLVC
jgi:hypothetical protein